MIRLLLTNTIAIILLLNPVYSQYDFNVKNIPDSLSSKANSVIRHSHVNIDMDKNKLTYIYDYAITALNKKHEDKLFFAASYNKGESKVKDVKITVYDAEGMLVRKIKKKEIKEYGITDIEFADDTRTMLYSHNSPKFPVTIHVTYIHEIDSPYFVRTWYPIPDFRQALEVASITIDDPAGNSFGFQAHNLPDPIEESPSRLHYICKQQKAYTKERYMPDLRKSLPRLEIGLKRIKFYEHLGYINDWKDFGSWMYNEMFLPKQDIDLERLKEETSHLISEEASDLIIAQKLYKYIQETTRYVLISLEDGGWSPLSTSTVHDRKYGDCKALSYYYNTLCNAHGIDATLALVYAGDEKFSAKEDFFSSSQFNHVISKLDIEDKTYWVDCTSKVNPFNYLGNFTDDRNVLLFDDDLGIITKTPEYKYIQKTNTSMDLSSNNEMDVTIDLDTEGINIGGKLYKMSSMSVQEKATYQKKILSEYRDPKIDDYTYEFDTTNLTFKEKFKIKCYNVGEKLGNHLKLKLNRGEIELPKFKMDKNRVWPIEFLRNKAFIATTRLKHDLSLVPKINDNKLIESEFGIYSFSTTASAGEILIERKLKINKGVYAQDRYNDIKSFFDKIKKIEKRSILLTTKS